MKVLIEIDENIMSAIKDHNVSPSQVDKICEQILNAIPLNGTNGDVIKAMFPNDSRNFLVVNMDRNDWWNSTYKGVE